MVELLREAWDNLFGKRLALTLIGIIFFVCILAALSTGFWLPTRLAYVIMLGMPLAYFWAKSNAKNLEVTTERPLDRLQEGQTYQERITVRNLSWMTKLWLEVEDPSDMPGHVGRQIITLGPRESRTWRISTLCRRRGLFSIGPIIITTGDPFGFFKYTKRYGRPAEHPRLPAGDRAAELLRAAGQPAGRGPLPAPHPLRDAQRLRRAQLRARR